MYVFLCEKNKSLSQRDEGHKEKRTRPQPAVVSGIIGHGAYKEHTV